MLWRSHTSNPRFQPQPPAIHLPASRAPEPRTARASIATNLPPHLLQSICWPSEHSPYWSAARVRPRRSTRLHRFRPTAPSEPPGTRRPVGPSALNTSLPSSRKVLQSQTPQRLPLHFTRLSRSAPDAGKQDLAPVTVGNSRPIKATVSLWGGVSSIADRIPAALRVTPPFSSRVTIAARDGCPSVPMSNSRPF